MKQKVKLIIILVVEFIAIAAILLMIFFAGKKSYTVTFDLNGGTLLSGDLEQRVTQGQSATPPTTAKDGCYFLKWSTSYNRVTRDLTIVAIWEYETTYGIVYNIPKEGKDSNYCTISGCFADLTGDVYIGAYYDERKVLGIEAGAFAGCEGITSIYLLDGILSISDNAFAGCTSLEKIELPSTLVKLGDNAFAGCENLKEISLDGAVQKIGDNAFVGCTALETVTLGEKVATVGDHAFNGCEALKTVTLGESLVSIGAGAFAGCIALEEIVLPLELAVIGSGAFDQPTLKVYACVEQLNKPIGWAVDCFAAGTTFEWGYQPPEKEDATDDENADKDDKEKKTKNKRG